VAVSEEKSIGAGRSIDSPEGLSLPQRRAVAGSHEFERWISGDRPRKMDWRRFDEAWARVGVAAKVERTLVYVRICDTSD
jgi:hypothetical protein